MSSIFAQDVKNEEKNSPIKPSTFLSKKGTIIKFIDYNLVPLKSWNYTTRTKIRRFVSSNQSLYFYLISVVGVNNTSTISIEYPELLDAINSLSLLKAEIEKDQLSKPDHLENIFTTQDGLQIGYNVEEKGKATWFLKSEKVGMASYVEFKDFQSLESTLQEAKNKIEELKK